MRRVRSALLLLAGLPGFGAGWNPKLAAEYLDSRQKSWSSWPPAADSGGACFSCHTQMTYLLARPILRRAAGDNQATQYEKAVLDGLRARVEKRAGKDLRAGFAKEPLASQAMGVEAIFAALFLARQDGAGGVMSPETTKAFDRLWALQIAGGAAKGAWPWFELDLDPWETQNSPFYGAALAALAVGEAPAAYRDRPDIRERIAALTDYLHREQESQPLHNRMMLLWASTTLPGLLQGSAQKQLIDEILARQQANGGWTIESLGPWKQRPQAPEAAGSNGYATGFAAFVLVEAGVPRSNAALARALRWLRSHQNPAQGYWEASSMNKKFPAGSMQEQFMRDAATGFAAMALLESGEERTAKKF